MLRHQHAAMMAVAWGLVLPLAAKAVPLTWAMEGTIQTVSDPLGLIGFAQLGGQVRYTFTFDSETPDTNPTPTLRTYLGTDATFNAGAAALAADPPQIDIQRHPTVHGNDHFNVTSPLSVAGMSGSVYFRLYDPDGTVLSSPTLPLQPYPLAEFAGTGFSCTILGPPSPNNPSNTSLTFYGEIDAFYAVPEPTSLALLAIGGLFVRIRRVR